MRKLIILLLVTSAAFTLSSCLKGAGNPAPAGILTGNWMLVRDSSYTSFWGLWSGLKPTSSVYIGTPSDHYDFMANGNVWIAQNHDTDTASFTLTQGTKLVLTYLYTDGQPVTYQETSTYTISNLSAHTMKLTSGQFISPETVGYSVLYLKK